MQNKSAYIWSLVGRILPQAIYLGTTMLLARFLSPSDFGVLGILSVFLMVANTLLDAGFGGSLVNEKQLTKSDCSTVFTFSLAMSLLLYTIMFAIAPFLESFYKIPGLTLVIRILCLIFIIQAFALVPSSLLVKQLKFKRLTIIRIIAVCCASIMSICYAFYHRNVYALVIYQLCQALVITIGVNFKKHIKLQILFKRDSFNRLFSFGLYTTLANILDTIYENLLAMILGKAVSVQQAGYLSQAKRIEEISTQTVTQTINSTSFPILSKKKNSIESFREEASSIFRFSILMITPLMLVLALFSKPIIILLFGVDWSGAAYYLSLLSIAGVFIIMETLNRTFIKSLGEVSTLFRITLIKRGIGVLIISVCLLFDIKWVMFGYIASSIVAFLINQIIYCKLICSSFAQSIINALALLSPSIVFSVLIKVLMSATSSLYIQISVTLTGLLFYYLSAYWYLKKSPRLTNENSI